MSFAALGDIMNPSKITRMRGANVPVLSMISESGLIVDENRKEITRTASAYKLVRYGQVVTGLHMDAGSIWVQNKVDLGAVSAAYDVYDVNQNIVDLDYLNYLFHTPDSLRFYRESSIGTNIRRSKVPWHVLKTMPVWIPGMEEQMRSVRAMRSIEYVTAAIQVTLSKVDQAENRIFAEYSSNSQQKNLEDVAVLTFGKTPTPCERTNVEGIPLCSGTSDFGEIFTKCSKYVQSSERTVGRNSIMVSVRDPVGRVNITSERCAVGRGVVGVSPRPNISDTAYLYLALKKKRPYLDSVSYGIIKGIGPKEIRQLSLDYIDFNRQEQLSKAFNHLIQLRDNLKRMLSDSQLLASKVLQERFSGAMA